MKLFKRTDIIIIAVVLLVAALLSVKAHLGGSTLTANIYVDGVLEESINLNEVENTYTLSPTSKTKIKITVGKGEIFFSDSDCKDKLCVKSGKLTSDGQTAACLPERVVISVTSNKNKTDIMTY